MFDLILKNKKFILIFFGCLTLALAPFAAKVKPDNSVESLGVKGDSSLEILKELEKYFGSEEFTSISFEAPDALNASTLTLIENITKDLEAISQVEKVMSLTRIPILKESTDGSFAVAKLIGADWIKSGVPDNKRNFVLSNEVWQRLIFNQDGKSTMIMAQFKPLGSDDALRDKILSEFEEITEKYSQSTGIKFHILGMPVVTRLNFGVVEREQNTINGLLMVMVVFIFWLLYRRLSLILLPLVLLGLVMIWIMGTIGLTGARFNWMLAIAPAVIVIISICNSIHVINAYLHKKDLTKSARVKFVISSLGLPCFFTTLTDLIGFFSISSSRIYAVRDFGIYVGLGSLYAFIATIFLLPIFLTMLEDQEQKAGSKKYEAFAQKILSAILNFDIKHPKKVLVGGLLVLLLAIGGIARMKVETHLLSMFKWGAQDILAANNFAAEKVGAGAEFDFYLNTSTPNYFIEPDHLRAIEKIQHRLITEVSNVTLKTLGLPDFVKAINQTIHGDDPRYYVIPDTKEEVAQLLLLVATDSRELYSVVTPDYSKARLRYFSAIADSAQVVSAAVTKCEKIVDEEMPAAVKHNMSGRPIVMMSTLYYILDSQVMSFGSACLVIFIALIFLFRSIKLGLISMVPNILPILSTLGVMGWLGIELDVATSMVASTVIGIAVDDTIHFLWNIKKMILNGMSYEEALAHSFREAGFSAFSATFVVVCGFMVFLLSQIWPATYFGVLTALACLLALITELFLTPALLLVLRPIKIKMIKNKS